MIKCLPDVRYETVRCHVCHGDKDIEVHHPAWGTRTCPEAFIRIECPRCDGTGELEIEIEEEEEA